MSGDHASEPSLVGRYLIFDEIASGGMASVHFGRLLGSEGFALTVAIKRMHAHLAKDPEFLTAFLDEARLAARIRHPNVVATLDVVTGSGDVLLVMEYVAGESLARLMRATSERGGRMPHRIAASIACSTLHGLHAAHEAHDEQGKSLGIVHRDVSPPNILVGSDGVTRLADFGVAKAAGRASTTREGQVKGKLGYMAPEQMQSGAVTRTADVYAAAVIFWESLTGQRLFGGGSDALTLARTLAGSVEAPSTVCPSVPKAYDAVVLKALARIPESRYATARELASAIEECDGVASQAAVAEWVESAASEALAKRAEIVAQIEVVSQRFLKRDHLSEVPAPGADTIPEPFRTLNFAAQIAKQEQLRREPPRRPWTVPPPAMDSSRTVVEPYGSLQAAAAAVRDMPAAKGKASAGLRSGRGVVAVIVGLLLVAVLGIYAYVGSARPSPAARPAAEKTWH